TLSAGTGETKTFGLMFGPVDLRPLDENFLFGSRITITEIKQTPDGTRTRDVSTYYVYRFLDATDDNHFDRAISFEDTLADGPHGVTREKVIQVRAGLFSQPLVTLASDVGSFRVTPPGFTPLTVAFDPDNSGEDMSRLVIRTPDNLEVGTGITLVGL